MAETETTISYRSYLCVGTIGRGLFPAGFTGPAGRPVLFSGAIRVHRVGELEGPGRRYVFECYGKGWPGSYLDDPSAARWYDGQGEPAEPVAGDGAAIATVDDYYGMIIPALNRLERLLSAEATPDELEPVRVGLVDCWQYRQTV
jgi:hypothetical protein